MFYDGLLDRADRLGRLMEALGNSVWQAQELEQTLSSFVVVRLRDARGVGQENGGELLRQAQSRTLGSLARELANAGVVSAEVADELDRIREARNWMVHHVCREERGVLDDPERYTRILSRLVSSADRCLALNRRLGGEVEEYAKATGVSPEFIEQESARLLREWGLDHLL